MYSNPTCKQILTPDSNIPPGVLGYLKVKNEIICLKKLIFIRPGLIYRGIWYFRVDSSTQSSLIVKISCCYEYFDFKNENLKSIRENPEVVYVVRLYTYDETCNIKTDIYHIFLKNRSFPLNDPPSNVGRRLNFGDNLKAKESSMNQILTKIVLLDSRRPLTEARSALKFLRNVYYAFVSKFLFIHPNESYRKPLTILLISYKTLYFHHYVLH